MAKFDDMQLLVPRGKYSFNMYSNYLKIHGKTHDYKILYKDINRAFLLPRPDGVHMNYIVSLKSPLRQGQTQHQYLVLQFKSDREEKIKLNMSAEEIKTKYGEELTPEIEGPLYDVLSKLLKTMIKVSIIVPSGFQSDKGAEAVKCSVRAQDGYLYPLQKAFLFIHKPVTYIKHEDILHLEFSRISEFAASGRSFDINIQSGKKGIGNMTFTGIDKQEFKPFVEYLKTKKLRVRNGDDEGKVMDVNEMEYLVTEKKGRNTRTSMPEIDDDLPDDESEEDEDFDVNAQEQEESEFDEDDDVSLMDESLDEDKPKKSKAKTKPKKDSSSKGKSKAKPKSKKSKSKGKEESKE